MKFELLVRYNVRNGRQREREGALCSNSTSSIRSFSTSKAHPEIAFEVTDYPDTSVDALLKSGGVGITVPPLADIVGAGKGVECVLLDDEFASIEYGVSWRTDHALTPDERIAIEFIVDSAAKFRESWSKRDRAGVPLLID